MKDTRHIILRCLWLYRLNLFLGQFNESLTPKLAKLPRLLLRLEDFASEKYAFFQRFIFASEPRIHFVPRVIMHVSEHGRVVMRWFWIVKAQGVADRYFEVLFLSETLRDVVVLLWWAVDVDGWIDAWPQRALEILATRLDFVSSVIAFEQSDFLLDLRALLTDICGHISCIFDWR